LPALKRVQRSAVSKRYLNDMPVIRDGAERYAMEIGNFPLNGTASLHSALQGYVPPAMFIATEEQLIDIDRSINGSNLNSGLFRKDGSKAIYVVQFCAPATGLRPQFRPPVSREPAGPAMFVLRTFAATARGKSATNVRNTNIARNGPPVRERTFGLRAWLAAGGAHPRWATR
jgi:hypothetical protein